MSRGPAFTHAQLVALACKWVKYTNARGGHGCSIAVPEPRGGWTGEAPDVIGYRFSGSWDQGTVVVECKTSRADFLANRAKPHRAGGGMGNWRYFLAPEGLIAVQELPQHWGLLEVNGRGHIKVVRGAFQDRNYQRSQERLKQSCLPSDRERELFVLTRLCTRVASPEAINEVHRESNRLKAKCNAMTLELHTMRAEASALRQQLAMAREKGFVD